MFLRWARRTAIRDLAEGRETVIEGRVVADRQISVPASGTRCVYYDVLIESYERGARGGGRKLWIPKSAERKWTGFHVDDGTGKVWIAADGEELEVRGGLTESGAMGKKGQSRYVARVVANGFMVRVKGLVSRARAAEPGDLVIRSGPRGRMVVLVKSTR